MKELDLFGEPFKFNYQGNYLFKTKFSAGISVLTLILYAFWGIRNLILMFQHNVLIINSHQTNISSDEYYTFGEDNLLAFQMVNSNGKYLFNKEKKFLKYFKAYSLFIVVYWSWKIYKRIIFFILQ